MSNNQEIRKNTLKYIQSSIGSKGMSLQIYIIMGLVDNFIIEFVMSRALQTNSRNKALFAFFCASLLIMIGHVTFLTMGKDQNLFQVFEIPRSFETEQLQVSWKIKKEELLRQLNKAQNKDEKLTLNTSYFYYQEVYDILRNPQRREFYDKANDVSGNYRFSRDPMVLLQLMIQPGITYLILVLSALSRQSEQEKNLSSQKWIVLTMVSLFLIEFLSLLRYSDKQTLIDYLLPYTTFYERREILKFCLNPIIISITFYFNLFVQSEHDVTLTILEGLTTNNQVIASRMEPFYQQIVRKEQNYNRNRFSEEEVVSPLSDNENQLKTLFQIISSVQQNSLVTQQKFAQYFRRQIENRNLLVKAISHQQQGQLPTEIERQIKALDEKDKNTGGGLFTMNNLSLCFFLYTLFKSVTGGQ